MSSISPLTSLSEHLQKKIHDPNKRGIIKEPAGKSISIFAGRDHTGALISVRDRLEFCQTNHAHTSWKDVS